MRVCANIANHCLFLAHGGIRLHNQINTFLILTIDLTDSHLPKLYQLN